MTILWGDTGKVAYGVLKTFNISGGTLATPYENLYASPIALGTALPGTPTDTYTVQATDFPTISPSPISVNWNAMLVVGGKNTVATAYTISYQINKNGTSIASGSAGSVTASQYYTITFPQSALNGIASGDKLDIYLYGASGSSFNYDYMALVIYPSRMVLTKAVIAKDVSYTLTNTLGKLTKGSPNLGFSGNFYIHPTTDTNSWAVSTTSLSGFTLNPNSSTYGFGQVQYTDNNQNVNLQPNATYRPYYYNNYIPTKITFREVLR